MNNVFEGVDPIKAFDHGWLNDVNKRRMAWLFQEIRPRRIVEIGTWCGKSLLYMAGLAPQAEFWPVDPWALGPEYDGYRSALPKGSDIWDIFRANMIVAGVTNRIHPIRMLSVDAAKVFEGEADLIYIDGSHEEANVRLDLESWWPKVREGGVMCGDDFDDPWPGVEPAVRSVFPDVTVEKPFWWKFK